ncbi:transcriptional regulator, y4mF family [Cyclobacterium xiamenense]|uniref:Transcriptional regulator, y4mF family n=2 Tax=Cyclobacterium xiamenense TaxID=1297121 RepID=A0A1H6W213_9BACT|nr:transcriptional regulator, y4mF family [Cyclobacterium xiamenense]
MLFLYVNAYNMSLLSDFVKTRRKQLGISQEEFAEKAGVALTVIRKIEQGKENLSLSKVNQVLQMFGHVLGPINENDAKRNS